LGRVVISVCIEPELYEAIQALKKVGFNVSAVCNDSLWAAVETYGPDQRLSEAGKIAVEKAVEISKKRKEEAEKKRAEGDTKKSQSFDCFLRVLERWDFVIGKLRSGAETREQFLKSWAETTGKTADELLDLICQKRGKSKEELLGV
jgi:hypothetical protein